MKTYNEMADSVLERVEAYRAKKRERKKRIKRMLAPTVCLAVIVLAVLGIRRSKILETKIPTAPQPPETTTAASVVVTSADVTTTATETASSTVESTTLGTTERRTGHRTATTTTATTATTATASVTMPSATTSDAPSTTVWELSAATTAVYPLFYKETTTAPPKTETTVSKTASQVTDITTSGTNAISTTEATVVSGRTHYPRNSSTATKATTQTKPMTTVAPRSDRKDTYIFIHRFRDVTLEEAKALTGFSLNPAKDPAFLGIQVDYMTDTGSDREHFGVLYRFDGGLVRVDEVGSYPADFKVDTLGFSPMLFCYKPEGETGKEYRDTFYCSQTEEGNLFVLYCRSSAKYIYSAEFSPGADTDRIMKILWDIHV